MINKHLDSELCLLIVLMTVYLCGVVVYNCFQSYLAEAVRNSLPAEITVARRPIQPNLLDQFNVRLSEASPKLYRNPGNNCYDQSKKLRADLQAMGIESSLLIADGRKHAWLGVWVDAVDGSFVKPGKYEIMEIRKTPTQVVCSSE